MTLHYLVYVCIGTKKITAVLSDIRLVQDYVEKKVLFELYLFLLFQIMKIIMINKCSGNDKIELFHGH